MRSNDAGPCLCGDPACRRCFPGGGTYDPPQALIDTLNGVLDDAIRRHAERSTEETFEEHVSHFAGINEPRKYTVRRLSVTPTDLKLYELGQFQAYPTLRRARTAARRAAAVGAALCPRCKLHLMYELETICTDCQEYEARRQAREVSA